VRRTCCALINVVRMGSFVSFTVVHPYYCHLSSSHELSPANLMNVMM
jgi:hypothetical protein